MPTFLLTWGEGVTAGAGDEDDFTVDGPIGRLSLRQLSPSVVDALQSIAPSGAEDERLEALVHQSGIEILQSWYYYLDRLTRRGLLCHSAHENGVPLATLIAISPSFVALAGRIFVAQSYVLSRFACLRREGTCIVIESPLAHAKIVLNDSRVAMLAAVLAAPATPADVARSVEMSLESVESVLLLLWRAEVLRSVDPDGTNSEDRDNSLQTWSFHDLQFHAHSRMGRSDAPFGATYRFVGRIPPSSALKSPMGHENLELPVPDMKRLEEQDPPLALVQKRRRSVRAFDTDRPISAAQLGEFLFRVARVKNCFTADVPTAGGPVSMEFASRPYPSGGSLYETEFYVAVQKCQGVEPGLFHYAPDRHVLERLSGSSNDVTAMLRDSAESASIAPKELQILLVLAARIPRLAWKYESIAYSLALKHVGVIFENMYLTATAMQLASCAVGCGDADLFARVTGIKYWDESSVGEFLLGSSRPELADRDQCHSEGE